MEEEEGGIDEGERTWSCWYWSPETATFRQKSMPLIKRGESEKRREKMKEG